MRTKLARAALSALVAGILVGVFASCTESNPSAPAVRQLHDQVGTTALPSVRFSEIHYDNAGTDQGEAIEISGPAGTNLTGYSIVLYNGNGGGTYTPLVNLTGTIPQNCTVDNTRGVVVQNYAVNGLQNGDPDGIALVQNGVVIEFLSYGGTFVATNGVALGMTSVDFGVKESSATPIGSSLQRDGAGVWSGPKANTFGTCNDDNAPPQAVVASVVVAPSPASIAVAATQQFTATALDASNQPIPGITFTWSSSNTNAATVSNSGLATGVSAGTTQIRATANTNSVFGEATLTVTSAPPPTLPPTRFSELHYDNSGTDINEAIEVEGPTGTDLTGWSIVLYDGNGGAAYNTSALSGTIPATCSGTGRGVVVVNYPSNGIQNGSPDGLALVNALGQVVEFLSYEGTMTAVGGPANGMLSVDIGVSEPTTSPVGSSLQRDAQGAWALATASFGGCNGGAPPPPPGNTITFSGRLVSDPALPIGMQDQLFGTEKDANNATVSATLVWSSDTPAIATIDQNGVFTALAAGSAILRATDAADPTVTATITLPTRIAVAGSALYGNHAEFGEPADADPSDDFILRRTEFTSSYNFQRNTPNWVSYDLDPTHFGPEDRCDCFTYDPMLPTSYVRYTTNAYTGAGAFAGYGIDRGHLTRSFDRTSGSLDNAHTFLFSNVVPQASDLNQGPWAQMENDLGDLARLQNKEVYIITGVAGNIGTLKGEGVVTIPAQTWKVAVVLPHDQGLPNIVNGTEPDVIAVIMPNTPGIRNNDWHMYLSTVDQIEALTGYDLLALLPDNIEVQLEKGNHFPTARTNGPYTGIEGSAISFSASTSTDPDVSDVLTYSWNFGDGTTGTGVSPTHTFANNGTYTVKVTVTDQGGASTFVTTTAVISNAAPVVALTPPAAWNANVSSNIGITFTDANVKDAPFTVRINWGDGSALTTFISTIVPSTPFARPHTYAAAGPYTITVTVTDRDGGVGTKTLSIVVAP